MLIHHNNQQTINNKNYFIANQNTPKKYIFDLAW